MPVNILLSKISIASAIRTARTIRPAPTDGRLVGLGGIEPPTSPLSGVRSSQLSYRPRPLTPGGAGRDRTGDLLNANQALSHLSYSPLSPPALSPRPGRPIAESRPLFFNRGQLDAETTGPAHSRFRRNPVFQVETPGRAPGSRRNGNRGLEWNGCLLLGPPRTPSGFTFRKLHPRSLLERR